MPFKFTLRPSNTLPPLTIMANSAVEGGNFSDSGMRYLSKQDPAGGHQQTSKRSHCRMRSLLASQKNDTATGHSSRRRVGSGRSITAARLSHAIHSKLRLTTRPAAILYCERNILKMETKLKVLFSFEPSNTKNKSDQTELIFMMQFN